MNELFIFFVGSFVSLFSIVDPLLAVPVFVSLTEKFSPEKRVEIASQASWYVFWVLVVFFIAGGLILRFFGISLEGLRIAGGLMIIGSAVEMLEKKSKLLPKEQEESESKDDIAFSPLAMPILSGPGAIAVMIGMTTDAKSWMHYPVILIVVILVSVLSYVFLRLAHIISSRMGEATMNSFNRIMGFLLLCIGVQYIVNGVMPLLKTAFHG
jgi:multiple antibiotic resistance protein